MWLDQNPPNFANCMEGMARPRRSARSSLTSLAAVRPNRHSPLPTQAGGRARTALCGRAIHPVVNQLSLRKRKKGRCRRFLVSLVVRRRKSPRILLGTKEIRHDQAIFGDSGGYLPPCVLPLVSFLSADKSGQPTGTAARTRIGCAIAKIVGGRARPPLSCPQTVPRTSGPVLQADTGATQERRLLERTRYQLPQSNRARCRAQVLSEIGETQFQVRRRAE